MNVFISSVPKKNAFVSKHLFLRHSIIYDADSFAVSANIKQDDRPLFYSKLHKTIKTFTIYICSSCWIVVFLFFFFFLRKLVGDAESVVRNFPTTQ